MQRRIILLVVVSIVIALTSVGIISHLSVNSSIDHSLKNHLALASIITKNIEYILETNITRLLDISVSGVVRFDEDWDPEKNALKTAYEYSIFTDGIFLVNRYGDVVLTYPYREEGQVNLLGIPYVSEVISEGHPVISNVYTQSPTQKKVIYVLAPLRGHNNEVIGAVGGEIDPANHMFTRIIKSIPTDEETFIELIDSNGIIISSNDRTRILTHSDHEHFLGSLIAQKKSNVGTCHRCHEGKASGAPAKPDMLAFAPLSIAPWGVAVREPKESVYAPATTLSKSYVTVSIVFIATGFLLAIGLSRSIVHPIRILNQATGKIAEGHLHESISISRNDEIGALAKGFDVMRSNLAASVDKIRQHNAELEQRVMIRTEEVNRRRKQLGVLLNQVIHAREEERKRIARELHDETSQAIAALGFSLEMATMALSDGELTEDMLYEQRIRVNDILEGISRLIKDLRPTVLDDLGFAPAVDWLLTHHLKRKGIKFYLSICDKLKGPSVSVIDKKTELGLFRIIQEAAINISKYANASAVVVEIVCRNGEAMIDIIDDGDGFDVDSVLNAVGIDGNGGFGLLGMKEHVEHLNGAFSISSMNGEGTHITIAMPLQG
ncbi:MAG: sensor histidine kinase [Thermodesulfovibrionales bacterium]